MRRKITIKDVARDAGVSATTVSYVLNQNEKQTISEETKARIYSAVERLNYIPNYAARIMKNDESRCVGLVMNRSFKIGRFSTVVAGIMDELEGAGYRVLLCAGMHQDGQYSGYLEDYFRHHLDGLIFICNNNHGPSEEDQKVIKANQIPMVVFDSLKQNVPYETVDFDYYQGAENVLERMIQPSMKQLIYLRTFNNSRQEEMRERAVRDVLFQYPDIQLHVIRETKEAEQCRRHENREELSGNYARFYRMFLERHALEILQTMQPEDGVLASLGIWLPMIYDMLDTHDININIATLAEVGENGWGKQKVTYGKYHNYQVGKSCAQILLQAIERQKVGAHQVNHAVMAVEAGQTAR